MLIFDFQRIGDKLYSVRKKAGLTQMEVADLAGIGDRTYADIERGLINTRIETILRICEALHITPDVILTQENASFTAREEELLEKLHACSEKDKDTALQLLDVFLRSVTLPDEK